MTNRRVGELEKDVLGQKVRYSLNKGKLILQPMESRAVQFKDGSFGRITDRRIALYGRIPHDDGFLSQEFDMSVKEDREDVEFIDDLLARYPEIANVNGVRKLSDDEVPPPGGMANWNEMTVLQIKAVLDGTGLDLRGAMAYELQQESPRAEVIKTIEQLHAKAKRETVERSDVAPTI
jgi:hypothetical protein